jgi:fluoride exporter
MTRGPQADWTDDAAPAAPHDPADGEVAVGEPGRLATPDPDPRPLHLRPSAVAVVAAGGAVGTAAREAVTLLAPPLAGIPVAVLAVNLAGAFLLGLLLEALVRRGPDHGRRRALRLLLGTGVLGGFTTYSALATDAAGLLADGRVGVGAGYALVTVLVGAAATWLGVVVAGRSHRSRPATR